MIRLEQLALQIGAFALRDVTLEIPDGGYGLIIGPSGSGKTTLLDAVAGHLPVSAGRITVRGKDVTNARPEARGIGIVYQHYHLFPHFSVRANIAYGLARGGQALARAGREPRVAELAQLLGLGDLLDRRIQGLSGGERQRVALARALAPRPRVLLLDEPFTALDPTTREMLRRELRALHRAEGVTTLQVTHDFTDALRLGDVVAVMHDGAIVQAGHPDVVFRYPNSAFVARFIGSGNVLAGTVVHSQGGACPSSGRFPALFRTGGITLEVVADSEGPMHAVIRHEDLLVSREPFREYPRNRLDATVTGVDRLGPIAMVHLDVQGTALTASVTAATSERLALHQLGNVAVAVKATAVHLV